MNIIKMRQDQRASRISIMQKSIEDSISPDIDKLIMIACNEWGLSFRTAKEYIKQAQFNIKCKTTA